MGPLGGLSTGWLNGCLPAPHGREQKRREEKKKSVLLFNLLFQMRCILACNTAIRMVWQLELSPQTSIRRAPIVPHTPSMACGGVLCGQKGRGEESNLHFQRPSAVYVLLICLINSQSTHSMPCICHDITWPRSNKCLLMVSYGSDQIEIKLH